MMEDDVRRRMCVCVCVCERERERERLGHFAIAQKIDRTLSTNYNEKNKKHYKKMKK